MAEKVFGCAPLVYQPAIPGDACVLLAGRLYDDHRRLQSSRSPTRFIAHENFWLNTLPARTWGVDGF